MNTLTESSSNFTFKRSDIETEKQDKKQDKIQSGSGLFCSDEFTKILLECFGDERPDIVCYLLCKLDRKPEDITKCDENDRNLLHYMTLFASHGNMVIHLGKMIKDSCNASLKSAINMQDKKGNTPTHYAAALGFNSLVKLYIDKGADLSLVNKSGEKVVEDNSEDTDDNLTIPTIVSVVIKEEPQSFTFRRDMINSDSDTEINRVENRKIDEPESFTFKRNMISSDLDRNADIHASTNIDNHLSSDGTEHFFQEIDKALSKQQNRDEPLISLPQKGGLSDLSIATDKIINGILNKTKIVESDKNKSESEMSISTNDILNKIMNKSKLTSISDINNSIKQMGGKKKSSKKSKKSSKKSKINGLSRIQGERPLTTFPDVSSEDQQYVDPVKSDGSDISDIARQISRQSSDIHERAVMKIIEILKLDKNKSEDVQKARNYKAAIYKMVREKNPLLNNFDRAVEMEKSITKEMLNSINIEKVSKEIEKHLSEKSASNKSESTAKSASNKSESTAKSASTKTESTAKSTKKSVKKQSRINNRTDSSLNSISFSSMSDSSNVFSTISY
jgi:hypothetical protein